MTSTTRPRLVPLWRVPVSWLRRRLLATLRDDAGMSTAEYAMGTIAAAAFGAVLYSVLTGDTVVSAVTSLVQRALTVSF